MVNMLFGKFQRNASISFNHPGTWLSLLPEGDFIYVVKFRDSFGSNFIRYVESDFQVGTGSLYV